MRHRSTSEKIRLDELIEMDSGCRSMDESCLAYKRQCACYIQRNC
jgi:hypothetical protein